MLLSEWANAAPSSGCMNQVVLDALAPVLLDMGAGGDPECWVAWGDDPEYKYSVLAPTVSGLVAVAVRLNPGGEGGPRATAKLVRWSRLQIGEFSIEAADGHRVVAVQVEGLVLKGTDDHASRICEFVRGLMAGADGRGVAASGPVVIQAVPAAAAAARTQATKVAEKPAGTEVVEAGPAAQAAPQTGPAGKTGSRKGAKGAKQELAWVRPHPIPISEEPPAVPVPAAPAPVPVQPAPPAQPTMPAAPYGAGPASGPAPAPPRPPMREPGSVWEVPEVDPATRDQKKPRTWRP